MLSAVQPSRFPPLAFQSLGYTNYPMGSYLRVTHSRYLTPRISTHALPVLAALTIAIFLQSSVTPLRAQTTHAQHRSSSAASAAGHTYSVTTSNKPDGFIVIFTNPSSSPPITAYYISYLCPPARRDAVAPDALLHYSHTPDLIPSNAILDFHLDKPEGSNSCSIETAVLFKDATASGRKEFIAQMRDQRVAARDEIISLKALLAKAAAGDLTAQSLTESLAQQKAEIFQQSSKSHAAGSADNLAEDQSGDLHSGRLEVVELVENKLQAPLKQDSARNVSASASTLAAHARDLIAILDQWQKVLTAGLPAKP
jgi:hypothetical protein